MTYKDDRLALFPDTARIENNTLYIGGQAISTLAERYGTPVYVFDRTTLDASLVRYKDALKAYYPSASSVTYAAKAFLCRAMAQWAEQAKLWMDCTGEAEIATAAAGGLEPSSIVAHGVNKSTADLEAAVRSAGTIVVDSLHEAAGVANVFGARKSRGDVRQAFPALWLRLLPGIAVDTHHRHTQTGQVDSKFGMTPDEIVEAARLCRDASLPLTGLHFHQGSNFRDASPLVSAIGLALDLAKEIELDEMWHFCPGGGWGVAYHEDELPQPDIAEYVRLIAQEVSKRCRATGLSLPILHLEPGRSLVARAGVAVYRVGDVKRRKHRTWLLIDGGMADNPRPALYGSRYSCLAVSALGRPLFERVSIGGPCCESGDVVIEDLPMPRIEADELIAIPASGAYHLSMANNYNGRCRPSAIWLEKGRSRLMIRRETAAELSQRDLSIV